MTDFPIFSYTSISENPTVSYTRSLKKVALSGLRRGCSREYPEARILLYFLLKELTQTLKRKKKN